MLKDKKEAFITLLLIKSIGVEQLAVRSNYN